MNTTTNISSEAPQHYPVLHAQLLPWLQQYCPGGWLIDATIGMGGHSRCLLKNCEDVRVLAIDADREMLVQAQQNLLPWQQSVSTWNGWFDDFFADDDNRNLLADKGQAAAILFDLGVSQLHYQQSGRGFSLQRSENIDMRLDLDQKGNAAELVNSASAERLEEIFRNFGEERFARAISRRIVRKRNEQLFSDSRQLAEEIARAFPPRYRYSHRFHPATRCFQALRIAVNRELERLEKVLPLAFDWLQDGGLMAVISFHSLEDRITKHFFRDRAQQGGGVLLNKKPLIATAEELEENPASRSAKLRLIHKGGSGALA